jgi:hypothetical protein
MGKTPLGDQPYKIAISREELRVLVEHREQNGEPLQSFVRRLIREQGEHPQDAASPMASEQAAAGAVALPFSLRQSLEKAAAVENRQPQELLEDAVRQYLHKNHRPLLARGAQGYTQAEVRRLIAERRADGEESPPGRGA